MKTYSVVGTSVPNVDAVSKACGEALYIADLKLPGMLCGRILRSKFPHAKILNIDVSKAKKLSGVAAVVTSKDIPQYGLYGIVMRDKPIFAIDRVRHLGDDVAGVAAIDGDTAEEACNLIEVEYEELPAVFDPIEAMKEGAPLVHEKLHEYRYPPSLRPVPHSNICSYFKLRRGDAEAGLKQADYIFQDEFKTQPVYPAPLETLGCIANVDRSGNITVWSNTQMPYTIVDMISDTLGIPAIKVRVIVPHVGGGFGLKGTIRGELACVVMSQFAQKPVKLIYSREETLLRHM